MDIENKLSLNKLFSSILISVVLLSTIILLGLNYIKTKDKLYLHLEETSKLTIQRLTKSLVPFIESYSSYEYQELIKNEMGDPDILAITINDTHMGKILGDTNYTIGTIRDKNWRTSEYNNTDKNTLQQAYLKLSAPIKDIAEVSIYYSDKFIQQELEVLIKESVIALILISSILLLVLFFTLHIFILKPIYTIVNKLKKTDTYGLPIGQLPYSSTIELSNLSFKINSMITEIKSSRDVLNQYMERYQLTITGINDGIWDWNIKDDLVYFSKL